MIGHGNVRPGLRSGSFVPAIAGISYLIVLAVGLSISPSSLALNASGQQIVESYQSHASQATAQYVLVQGLASLLLGVVVIYVLGSKPSARSGLVRAVGAPRLFQCGAVGHKNAPGVQEATRTSFRAGRRSCGGATMKSCRRARPFRLRDRTGFSREAMVEDEAADVSARATPPTSPTSVWSAAIPSTAAPVNASRSRQRCGHLVDDMSAPWASATRSSLTAASPKKTTERSRASSGRESGTAWPCDIHRGEVNGSIFKMTSGAGDFPSDGGARMSNPRTSELGPGIWASRGMTLRRQAQPQDVFNKSVVPGTGRSG